MPELELERWREKYNRSRLQDSGAAQHSKFPNFPALAAMMVQYSPLTSSPLPSSKGPVVVTLPPGPSMCLGGCPNSHLHHAS